MTRKRGTGMSLGQMEGPKRHGRVGRPRNKTAYDDMSKEELKGKLWSKLQTMNILQEALAEVGPKSPMWAQIFRQYAQCRGFYAEPAQLQGANVMQVIALRHFDTEEEFYAEAKKQQAQLVDKNKKVIEQMEEERERESTED